VIWKFLERKTMINYEFIQENIIKKWDFWISIVVSLFGIYLTFKFNKQKKLCYVRMAMQVLNKSKNTSPKNVKIQYKEKSIPRLTRTIICLWNSGNDTIRKTDVAKKITFQFSNPSILDASVLKKGRDECKTKIHPRRKSVSLDFEFLDPHDGITFEIIHFDEKQFPEVIGGIKGLPQGFTNSGNYFFASKSLFNRLFPEIVTLSFTVLILYLLSDNAFIYPYFDSFRWLLVIYPILIIIIHFFLNRISVPKYLMPYEDNERFP
jgi:hypothetical protein